MKLLDWLYKDKPTAYNRPTTADWTGKDELTVSVGDKIRPGDKIILKVIIGTVSIYPGDSIVEVKDV